MRLCKYVSIEGQGHFFTVYFPGLYVLCFTGQRYQVSVYRTIDPLGFFCYKNVRIFCIAMQNHCNAKLDSHIFPRKNNSVFVIFMFLMKR